MALSRVWQAAPFIKHAMASFPAVDEVAYAQRFELINLVQYKVASALYSMMTGAYQTIVIMAQDIIGKIGTGGTWIQATSTLTVSGLTANFVPGDVQKLITFTDGTNTYCGFISAYIASTQVQVYGNLLPSGNIAVLTSVILVPTVPTSDSISLAGVDMMRTGEQINVDINSSTTSAIEAVSLEALRFFRNMSTQNRSRIVYSLVGDRVILDKGSAVSTYGTILLYYPRSPVLVAQDTDFLDLPDGGVVNMAMVVLKHELNTRFYHEKRDFLAEGQAIITGLYAEHKEILATQTIQEKMSILM